MLDESEELALDVALGVGAALALGAAQAQGEGLELEPELEVAAGHHPVEGKWNRKRSHLPSSTDSRFHHRKSLCMALDRSHPHHVSLWHNGWRCGP